MGINFLIRRVRPGIALVIGVALLQYGYPFQGGGYIVPLLTGLFILVGALGVINPAWTTSSGPGASGGGGADGGGGGGGGGGGE